ncbi:hypothetical protein SXM_1472 [Shewanella xiamenensis]|nr:hypothetical protein SXM_1472 [Shewanella xiamenensis]
MRLTGEQTVAKRMVNLLGRVDVSRLDFVRSGKFVLAKRGMMCSYSTQMTSDKEQGLARRTLRAAFGCKNNPETSTRPSQFKKFKQTETA